MSVLDHTMLRVSDLDRSVDWYTTHLNYDQQDRYDGDGFTIVYLAPTDAGDDAAMLELTHNEGETVAIGDAWGHVAVRVEDVHDAYYELLDQGVPDYRRPEDNPGYAFVRDPDGHEIEIVERDLDASARWSIDHTMIRTEDATQALGFWVRAFEYEPAGRWEADTFANYFLRPPDAGPEAMSVELTYNYDGRTYTQADGWGHLCVQAGDLQDSWDQLMRREAPDYRDPAANDNLYAFTKTPTGHEIELLEREDTSGLFPF